MKKCDFCHDREYEDTNTLVVEIGKKRKTKMSAYVCDLNKSEYSTTKGYGYNHNTREETKPDTKWLDNSSIIATSWIDIQGGVLELGLDVPSEMLARGYFKINYCPFCGKKIKV